MKGGKGKEMGEDKRMKERKGRNEEVLGLPSLSFFHLEKIHLFRKLKDPYQKSSDHSSLILIFNKQKTTRFYFSNFQHNQKIEGKF